MEAATGAIADRSIPRVSECRRQFRLSDAMILVAATAIGCGFIVSVARENRWDLSELCFDLFSRWPIENWSEVGDKPFLFAFLTMPIVAMATLALIPIRLLGPRPRRRRLVGQPGLLAAFASGVAIGLVGLPIIVAGLTVGDGWMEISNRLATTENLSLVTRTGGFAVVISWMILIVGRRWRPESSWVDRLGRALGATWIFTGPALWAGSVLNELTIICSFPARRTHPSPAAVVGKRILELAESGMPLVMLTTLAVMPVCFLARRPRWRRRISQPGILALCAAGFGIGLLLVPIRLLALALDESLPQIADLVPIEDEIWSVSRYGGLAVLVSWMTLIVGRRRRAQPSRVDRLGRVLGVVWIVAGLTVGTGIALVETDDGSPPRRSLSSSPASAETEPGHEP